MADVSSTRLHVQEAALGAWLLLPAALAWGAGPSTVADLHAGADLRVPTHIDQVTVYRHGATVMRVGAVKLPQGAQRLIIDGLPAQIDPKSLRVALSGAAVELAGVEVVTRNESKLVSDAERDLTRRLEERNDQRSALQDEIATAEVQLKLIQSLAENPGGSKSRTSLDGAGLSSILAAIGSNASAARKRIRETHAEMRALDREIEKLKADLGKVATRSTQSTEVRASLEAGAAAATVVTVSYAVADAGWEWIYEARLDTRRKAIALQRQGEVRQGSGEDWSDVALTLTTAEPSADAATPVIPSLFLDLAQPRVFARQRMAAAPAPAMAGNLQEVIVTGAKAKAVVSGTGYITEFTVPARVSVSADREPRVFPIADEEFGVDLVARVVPFVNRAAHLEARFTYQQDVPIEAGSMQLYRDGGYVGAAATAAFLPGAEVRMPFGTDERIRVDAHDEAAQSGERGVFSRQNVKETRRRYDVVSFHSSPIAVEVVDRIPVSKHADIHVESLKGATEPTAKDLDGKAGVILWKFEAQPQKTNTIRNFYSIRYPQDRALEESEEDLSE